MKPLAYAHASGFTIFQMSLKDTTFVFAHLNLQPNDAHQSQQAHY
jgi:hypothetical protein